MADFKGIKINWQKSVILTLVKEADIDRLIPQLKTIQELNYFRIVNIHDLREYICMNILPIMKSLQEKFRVWNNSISPCD